MPCKHENGEKDGRDRPEREVGAGAEGSRTAMCFAVHLHAAAGTKRTVGADGGIAWDQGDEAWAQLAEHAAEAGTCADSSAGSRAAAGALPRVVMLVAAAAARAGACLTSPLVEDMPTGATLTVKEEASACGRTRLRVWSSLSSRFVWISERDSSGAELAVDVGVRQAPGAAGRGHFAQGCRQFVRRAGRSAARAVARAGPGG